MAVAAWRRTRLKSIRYSTFGAALADIAPMTPRSRTSGDPFDTREQPVCDSAYWVDNLHNTVQFAAAVQAAWRRLPGLRGAVAHPLHAVEQRAGAILCRSPPGRHAASNLCRMVCGLLTGLCTAGAAEPFGALPLGGW